MKTFKDVAFVLSTFLFVAFGIVCVFIAIMVVFHAFSNPSLTTTENILWIFESKLRTTSVLGMLVSYAIMNILYDDRKNK